MSKKIKVLFISNFSKALTGFGKNLKNVLIELQKDNRFEIVEAANGASFGADLKTPWKSYGTYPSDPKVLQELKGDQGKNRLAQYGNYTIDTIIELEKPDIVVGIEDVWAFDWGKRIWFDKIKTIIWTTLDSSPILETAYILAPKVDKFLVWASFAEKEMKAKGFDVETLHGAIDYSHFFPLENRLELRKEHGIKDDEFVVGFVFKNQLRKSVPNLLEGFKQFQKENPNSKLLLHTDWPNGDSTWDIEKYVKEKGLKKEDVLATYICKKCRKYFIKPYFGEELNCEACGSEKSLVTKTNAFGVSEEQLNEVYNLMDVYCHPFTSGGQELPVQEAKAAGLITLVTEYSCGTDCCYEHQGGFPLKWVEYREPFTQFIKATTLPESICENLIKVKDLSKEKKEEIIKNGRKYIEKQFSVENTVEKLKGYLLELGKTDWDFDFVEKKPNYKFVPDFEEDVSDLEWAKSLYKGFFDKNFKEKDIEIIEAEKLVKNEGRHKLFEFLKAVATQKKDKIERQDRKLEDFLDENDEKRIAVIMPESAGDVLLVNSLLGNLKQKYPEYSIYFVTDPKYYAMVDSHPAIKALIPYQQGMDNLLLWEGQGKWKGHVDIAFLPFVGPQRHLNYLHGPDKENYQFNLYSKDFPCKCRRIRNEREE